MPQVESLEDAFKKAKDVLKKSEKTLIKWISEYPDRYRSFEIDIGKYSNGDLHIIIQLYDNKLRSFVRINSSEDLEQQLNYIKEKLDELAKDSTKREVQP